MLMIISLFRRDVYIYQHNKKKTNIFTNFRFYKVRFYNGYNVRFYKVRFYNGYNVRFYNGYNVRFYNGYKVRFYNGYNVRFYKVRFYNDYVSTTVIMFVSTKFVSTAVMFLQRL